MLKLLNLSVHVASISSAIVGLLCGIAGSARASAPTISSETPLTKVSYGRTFSDLEDDILRSHTLSTRQVAGDEQSQVLLWGTSSSLHYAVRSDIKGSSALDVRTIGAGVGRVAFDGKQFLVVWTDLSGDLQTTLINRDGTVAGPGMLVAHSATIQDVVFDGSDYLAIAKTPMLIAIKLDRTGAVLAPGPILLESSGGFDHARVAAGDGIAMLVMADGSQQPAPRAVWAMRLSQTGTPLDAAPAPLSVPRTAAHNSAGPTVAFGAGRFLVAWTDELPVLVDTMAPFDTARRIEGTWLGTGSPPQPHTWFAITKDAVSLGLGHIYDQEFDGANFVISTNYGRFVTLAPDDVSLKTAASIAPGSVSFRLDPAVARQDMRLASGAEVVGAAFDGSNYLVAFHDDIGLGAVRVGPDGALLDTSTIRLTTGIDVRGGSGSNVVRILAGGGEFLAVWYWQGQWFGNRVTGSGQVLDGDGFAIGDANGGLRDLNVVYQNGQFWFATCNGTITGLLRIPDGTLGNQQPPDTSSCKVVCGEASCLVFEKQTHLWTPTRDKVIGSFCDTCGDSPVATSGPTGFAVQRKWMEIALDILNADGSVRAATPVIDDGSHGYVIGNPELLYDGSNYVYVWLRMNVLQSDYHLFATWVSPSGAVLAAPYEITPHVGTTYTGQSSAAGPPGQFLVSYSRGNEASSSDGALLPYAFVVNWSADVSWRPYDGGFVPSLDAGIPDAANTTHIDVALAAGRDQDGGAKDVDAATSLIADASREAWDAAIVGEVGVADEPDVQGATSDDAQRADTVDRGPRMKADGCTCSLATARSARANASFILPLLVLGGLRGLRRLRGRRHLPRC